MTDFTLYICRHGSTAAAAVIGSFSTRKKLVKAKEQTLRLLERLGTEVKTIEDLPTEVSIYV